MLSVMTAFRDGDLAPLFAILDPAIVWRAHAPREFFRFGGTHRGLAGVKEYTALLASRYHFTRLKPLAVTARAEQVWGLFDAEAMHIPSGRYVTTCLVMRWTIRDDRLVEHQGFFDTAGVLMQQGELAAAAA